MAASANAPRQEQRASHPQRHGSNQANSCAPHRMTRITLYPPPTPTPPHPPTHTPVVPRADHAAVVVRVEDCAAKVNHSDVAARWQPLARPAGRVGGQAEREGSSGVW